MVGRESTAMAEGISEAVDNGIQRAGTTLRHLDWFEVTGIRGQITDTSVSHYQVTMKIGFRFEDEKNRTHSSLAPIFAVRGANRAGHTGLRPAIGSLCVVVRRIGGFDFFAGDPEQVDDRVEVRHVDRRARLITYDGLGIESTGSFISAPSPESQVVA